MFQRMSIGENRTPLRLSAANVILVANAFIWYSIAFITLKELNSNASTPDTLLVFGVNLGAIALSGLLGSFLVDRFKKRERLLFIWITIGIVLSLVPLGLNVKDINQLTIVSLIFGVYFGLGMPATMGYHSSLTGVEDRAKIGGFTYLIIFAILPIVGLIVSSNLAVTCLVLALVRVIGLIIFYFMRGKEKPFNETSKVKYGSIIANKSFVLYFIPWLMFTLINYMVVPILNNDTTINYVLFSSWEYVVVALVAVISGFVADRWGRKRLTIIGFVMLGIGYAVLGLTSTDYPFFGAILYTITDGMAWGIFSVLFLFTLWGDLAQNRNSDKFYFLGVLPYVSSYVIQLLLSPIISAIANIGTIFSFASVFLFIAVLPLIYAPETLPEKLMKDRDLKSYIENAKKKVQKESDKVHRNEKPQETKNPTGYEEAVKLAEKYY
jgi:MFS family permease